ncbi:P68 family surface lipoprotein [Mesomycoplasma flocculare]|uniref:P68 family surface lipoprotein n=1 Tax=Mesomycoplasma flocculare TaxID=2128 RepID=UPI0013712029|nr:hypothetical protein [Mesomycoplasma flocculare]MXR23127.1 hypothetical protein [Mesomycoplasma flocculare]
MNFKKYLKIFTILSPSFFLLAAGCGGNPETNITKKEISLNEINPKTQVVLMTSQGAFWPLIFGLNEYGKNIKGLIPYYNEKFKNDADFAPVRLVLNNESKAKTQSQITQNIKNLLDSNSDQIPSLVLGDLSTASVLKEYNRLLEIKDDKLNPSLFVEKLISAYNATDFGENKFYNIPFNKNDVDALGFNLDNLKIVFDLIEQGGGSVDKTMEIYKKALDSVNKGNQTPENSFFKAIEVKKSDVFKDLNINKESFENIETALEFATKFIQGLKIKNGAKIDENTENATIFVLDYSHSIFQKDLISKTGKHFWKPEGKQLAYLINSDSNLRDEFRKTYDNFTKNNQKLTYKIGEKTKVLQAFQFKDFKAKGIGEWGSHDLLHYRTVFGYIPAVGIKQSIDSATTRFLFAKNKPENVRKFATFNDIFTTNQPLKAKSNSPFSVFYSGGSSLIPIRTGNEKIDMATVKFLVWLYTGQNDIEGKMVDNADYLMENTGYFIPTKAVMQKEKLAAIKAKYQEYCNKINEFEKQNKKSFELIGTEATKIDWNLYEKAANLRSVIISIESMFKALKEKNNKLEILTDNGDFKATKISNVLLDSFIEATRIENPQLKTGEELLKLIDEQN